MAGNFFHKYPSLLSTANWPRIGGNTYFFVGLGLLTNGLVGSSVGNMPYKYLVVSLEKRDNQRFHNPSTHTGLLRATLGISS